MLSYIFDGTNPIKMAIYIEVFQLFSIKKNYLYLLKSIPRSIALLSYQSISFLGGGTISSGCFRISEIASDGQVEIQRPQPIHFSLIIL